MSGQSSEEKKLPPSAKKLKQAREKGQAVTSKDTLASVATLVVLTYLFMRRGMISQLLHSVFAYVPRADMSFADSLAELTQLSVQVTFQIVVPLMILVIAIGILVGMAISSGPMFSVQPLTPDFNKLNPVTGLTKIFNWRAMMTFVMHLVRITLILSVLSIIMFYYAGALLGAPPCGLECAQGAAMAILVPMFVALAAMLILTGFFDYMVQRAGFLREQKMTVTEYAREMKEQHGDPQLRGKIRAERRMITERPSGISQATVILYSGTRLAIGLRYVQGETPAPLVVVRGRGPDAVARIMRATKVPLIEDRLTVALISMIPIGEYVVKDEQILAVAPHLKGG